MRQDVDIGCAYSIVNVADNSTTVSAVPSILYGIIVNTALSAHALPIKDGATTVYTLAASTTALTMVTFPLGIRFTSSIVVDPDDAATGNITLLWN